MAILLTLNNVLEKKNLEQAYFDVLKKFTLQNKIKTYHGSDGITVKAIEPITSTLLAQVYDELQENIACAPVLERKVAKADGSKRSVYLYSIVDRVKAEALYRTLQPIIEPELSPFLYSYRSSKPHYLAAKSIAKRHRAYHKKDHVLRIDIQQFTDHLDHAIIQEQLLKLGIEKALVERVLTLAKAAHITEGSITTPTTGSKTGLALTALLANLYLNDVDKVVGKQVPLYRRVGDDCIACDPDTNRLQSVYETITHECSKRGLPLHPTKTMIVEPGSQFTFLGYSFYNGIVSIADDAVERLRLRFARQVCRPDVLQPLSSTKLIERWFIGTSSVHEQYIRTLHSYAYVTNTKQMLKISEELVRNFCKALFGSCTPRHIRKTINILQYYRLPTLYDYYCKLRRGHTNLGSLALSATKRYKAALKTSTNTL